MIFKILDNISYSVTFTVNDIQMTYLMMGAYYGYTNFVKLLLNKKIDIDIKNDNGQTALMFAVATNRLDIVSLLVDAGADVNAQDNQGNYVLQVALLPYSNYGDSRIFEYLIKHGADTERVLGK